MKPNRVLVVDDDAACLSLMEMALRDEGFDVVVAQDGRSALEKIEKGGIELVVSDIHMPHLTGDLLLRAIKKQDRSIAVVLVTAHSALDAAARAVIDGAFDYLNKPFNINELIDTVKRALDHRNSFRENKPANTSQPEDNVRGIIGRSRAMLELFKLIGRAAPSDATILILGESGTGKEVIAREIHKLSQRSQKKFVAVNCGALTETLLESELFGHTKGAFTGASADRRGLFEEANGGTLFLDEVTETNQSFQLKLLRALQEGEIMPVGSSNTVKVNVRIIAASNQDIEEAVKEKRFRSDLLYRLRVITMNVPPLRARREDIPLLVEYFIKRHTPAGRNRPQISAAALDLLQCYDWPGNVRELEHAMERAVVLNNSNLINPDDLPEEVRRSVVTSADDAPVSENEADILTLAEVQYRHVCKVLNIVEGNKSRAARLLGIDRKTLDRMLDRHKTDPDTAV